MVDSIGNVKNAWLLQTLNPYIDNEILRVLTSLPKVKPGIINSQNVNVNFILNIRITADSVNRTIKSIVWGNPVSKAPPDNDKNIFAAVEQPPSFTGGMAAFSQYLAQNIVYPAYAKQNNIQGRVILSFIVEKDGSITNMHILRSPDDELSIEALRVMRACPNFIPGVQNGKPVRVTFVVPLNFSLGK